MSRSRLRTVTAVGASVSILILLLAPGSAFGGAAQKGSDHYVELFCDGLTGSGGTLFFGANVSDVNGANGGFDAFGPRSVPFVDPAIFTADFEASASGTVSGGQFSVSIPALDAAGEPAGSLVVTATLAVAGPSSPINDVFKDGNHQFRSDGTFTPLVIVSGMATLPNGASFVLENGPCAADDVAITFFGNNPTSAIAQFDQSGVNCALMVGGEQIGNLFVDVDSDRLVAFMDAFFASGVQAFGELTLVNGHASATLDFFDGETGTPAGTGSIDFTIAATGERFAYTLRGGTQVTRVRGEAYDVSGTLVAPGYPPIDLGQCVFADRTTKDMHLPAQAPKPTGKAPANDLPSAATSVKVGTRLTENTKSAAFDMEVAFPCLTFLDENNQLYAAPVIKTVWFKLTGAGATVTLDTAGSGFDTVLAVYTKTSAGAYAPVEGACSDDVAVQPIGRTLQAATTFVAAAGVTYYIQVGGFPDDLNWGDLRLAVR